MESEKVRALLSESNFSLWVLLSQNLPHLSETHTVHTEKRWNYWSPVISAGLWWVEASHQVDKVLVADLAVCVAVGQGQQDLQLVRVELRAVCRQQVPETLRADESRILRVILSIETQPEQQPSERCQNAKKHRSVLWLWTSGVNSGATQHTHTHEACERSGAHTHKHINGSYAVNNPKCIIFLAARHTSRSQKPISSGLAACKRAVIAGEGPDCWEAAVTFNSFGFHFETTLRAAFNHRLFSYSSFFFFISIDGTEEAFKCIWKTPDFLTKAGISKEWWLLE